MKIPRTGERWVTNLANLHSRFSVKIYNRLLAPVRELDYHADEELHLDVSSPARFLLELRRV